MTAEKTEIFRTVHGSRLYGLSHAGSDHDEYRVYADARKGRHYQSDELDLVRIGLADFLQKAHSGSHQSLEALFSPEKVYAAPEYAPMLENMIVPLNAEIRETYRRTIHRLSHDDFKRRRHALRLAYNIRDLGEYGRFNARLSESAVRSVTALADKYEGEACYEAAHKIAWFLGEYEVPS